jgi:hypothetical protein
MLSHARAIGVEAMLSHAKTIGVGAMLSHVRATIGADPWFTMVNHFVGEHCGVPQ